MKMFPMRANVKSNNAKAVIAKNLLRSKCHLWNFRKLIRIGIRKCNLLRIRMLLLILEVHQLKIQFHRLHKINLLKVRFLLMEQWTLHNRFLNLSKLLKLAKILTILNFD